MAVDGRASRSRAADQAHLTAASTSAIGPRSSCRPVAPWATCSPANRHVAPASADEVRRAPRPSPGRRHGVGAAAGPRVEQPARSGSASSVPRPAGEAGQHAVERRQGAAQPPLASGRSDRRCRGRPPAGSVPARPPRYTITNTGLVARLADCAVPRRPRAHQGVATSASDVTVTPPAACQARAVVRAEQHLRRWWRRRGSSMARPPVGVEARAVQVDLRRAANGSASTTRSAATSRCPPPPSTSVAPPSRAPPQRLQRRAELQGPAGRRSASAVATRSLPPRTCQRSSAPPLSGSSSVASTTRGRRRGRERTARRDRDRTPPSRTPRGSAPSGPSAAVGQALGEPVRDAQRVDRHRLDRTGRRGPPWTAGNAAPQSSSTVWSGHSRPFSSSTASAASGGSPPRGGRAPGRAQRRDPAGRRGGCR